MERMWARAEKDLGGGKTRSSLKTEVRWEGRMGTVSDMGRWVNFGWFYQKDSTIRHDWNWLDGRKRDPPPTAISGIKWNQVELSGINRKNSRVNSPVGTDGTPRGKAGIKGLEPRISRISRMGNCRERQGK